jgi:hypothetical protein
LKIRKLIEILESIKENDKDKDIYLLEWNGWEEKNIYKKIDGIKKFQGKYVIY